MNLNQEQIAAINSTSPKILCLAAAGAGKSTVLVNRIDRLIKEGVDPSSILSLTFTNAAAFEMGEKFKRIQSKPLKAMPEFRTFHGFCYSLIVKDRHIRNKLGYSNIPNICTDAKYKEIDKTVKLSLKFKVSEAKLSNESLQTKEDKFQIKIYRKALRKELVSQNLITFDILCYNVCELFTLDDPVVKKYKEHYKFINVDEFQDSDHRQFEFVASFPDETNIFLVADALQNIYQFRGCTNHYVKQLSVDPNWQNLKLHKNYRSTNQICQFANKFSRYAEPEYRIEMEGQRDGESVEVIRGANSSYEEPVDSRHMKMLIDRLKDDKTETAVLCRTNKEVAFIQDKLKQAGITCITSSKSSEARDMLESSLNNDYLAEWLLSCLDAEAYADYVRLKSITPDKSSKEFVSMFKDHRSISTRLGKILKVRRLATDSSKSLEERFNEICKLLRIKTKCQFDNEAKTPRQVIEATIDQLEEITDDNLYVGTIHSSKGLEYERVYVVGVDDRSFQLGTEEMNNLYYVAITRAKNYLTVFRA